MPKQTTDDKLDHIIALLEKMNSRDRLRTIGGFIRGILGLIPIAILIFSIWYFYQFGDELMAKIADQAAQSAAKVTGQGAGDIMKQLQQYLPQ